MKTLIVILIFLVGGWYYLVNFHYAIDNDDKSLERYMASEKYEKDTDIDSDTYQSEDIATEEKKRESYSKKEDNPTDTNIYHSIYDEGASAYKCDGRTRCSQMRSCAEAKFFLANCKGVMMDIDKDGVPCESQWCGGGMVY